MIEFVSVNPKMYRVFKSYYYDGYAAAMNVYNVPADNNWTVDEESLSATLESIFEGADRAECFSCPALNSFASNSYRSLDDATF